ncbi:hypothetical protein [Streptomyces sp. NPDC056039]|uniref:hypothetical protein n=1 Tax=Streptomyces sp. NPDC056039 TaxID=3345687 RepID=UPI0035DBD449
MRVRATAATAALILAALTACGGNGSDGSSASKTKAAAASKSKKVDCTSQTLDQAEWMEHCADEASTDADTGVKSTGLNFGESYKWPDGLKVTVVEAKVWTTFTDEDFVEDDPKATEFRVLLKLENTGKAPAQLDDVSTFIEGATNGGEAAFTEFTTDSEPLGGRLAPGVTVTKTDDNSLESKYGKKIVVTVQRNSEDFDLDFPEFNGEITG